jgi:prevent-host-death family protein
MTTTTLTSREFNQDSGRAKRAAQSGPVYITDRGRPSYVLLTFESYERLTTHQTSMTELLSSSPGVEDADSEIPVSRQVAEPARFD